MVRRSRVELDGSVYCVILSTPQLTQSFLRDPFLLFENSGISPSPPQFLYLLNSNGIPPVSFNNRFTSSITIDPSAQRQLDSLSAQCDAMAATVCSLADDQKQLLNNFKTAQDNITQAFADSTAVYAATNLVSTAQAELTSLQQSLTTVQLMSVLAPNSQAQQMILDSIANLTNRIDTATSIRDARAQELRSLQSQSLPMLAPARIPDLVLLAAPAQDMPMAGPSSGLGPPQKRARTSTEDQDELSEDVRDASLVASNMLVDPQPSVCIQYPSWLFLQKSACTYSFPPLFLSVFAALKAFIHDFFSFLFLPLNFSCLSYLHFSFPSRLPAASLFTLSFLLFCSLFPSVQAMPPVSPVSLRTVSINANGLGDPMKIATIQNMIQTSNPHSFVIGETKNSDLVTK